METNRKKSSENPWVIGITGSMGAGKSTLGRLLASRIPTADCDEINRRLLMPGQAGYEALRRQGLLFADASGNIDRQKMADAMFEDADLKKQMEAILHQQILEEMHQWIQKQSGLCAVEVPLLFEAGLEDEFDEIWTVVCSPETALSRLKSGRNIDEKEARRRLASQMDPAQKAARSDAVLCNEGSLKDLEAQLDLLLQTRRPLRPKALQEEKQ